MIIRILGQGQYSVDDSYADELNALDSALEQAVESGDEAAFRPALNELVAKVAQLGEPLPDDALQPSDAAVPSADATLAEVKDLLAGSDEGLIPG
jgi:PspAA-like protein